jgi:arylamine N-acetyltransferase
MDERDARAVGLFQDRFGAIRRGVELRAHEGLLRAFTRLPYENLSKIVAWDGGRTGPAAALRDPLVVVQDHLALGTGGTCFSLTELLRTLLVAAGLGAEPVMAHMRHGANIHCALRVTSGGRTFLVDPGYLLEEPLPLEQGSSTGGVFLARAGSLPGTPEGLPPGELDLYTIEREGPRWRYRLADRAASPDEFLAHWHRSFTLPAMRSLVATRREAGELLYLHNHKLRRQAAGGARTANVRAEPPGSVQQVFGIAPEVTRRAVEILRAQRQVRGGEARSAEGRVR